MKNKYFPEEEISRDDLYHLLSVANVLHCENPLQVEEDWTREYHLEKGNVDVTKVDEDLGVNIPSATQMGKVYVRLIQNTSAKDEDYVDGILCVYNDPICETIDNYNSSAYYEPSYVIARAYLAGGF